MKAIATFSCFLIVTSFSFSQTVTNIATKSHDGQIFITWTNIPACDTGFYYVYKNSIPITDITTFENSQYLGRVPFNFGFDYRLSSVLRTVYPGARHYLVTNDTSELDSSQNLFVMNATVDGAKDYFAVRCDFGLDHPNWTVVSGENRTTNKIAEHIQPIVSYLQLSDVDFPSESTGEKMDIYIHYGSNVSVGGYPAMTNEGCLPFHFGIIKSGPINGKNAFYLKFHGGGGDFYNNAITSHIDNSWKISFDDWIPAFIIDSTGTNTRWLGYNESFNIYSDSLGKSPPKSGIVHAYTLSRVSWEQNWILGKWNTSSFTTIDTTRTYIVGTSQGCSGVLLESMTRPWRFAAGSLTLPKYNLTALDDANPACRFNDDGSQVKQTRIYFGNEDSTSLYTDILIRPDDTSHYKIYDLTNMDYMFHTKKDISLPFLTAINGKTDNITCWQEKIPFYDTIQATHCGGMWEWDLRAHSGTDSASWPALDARDMLRFSTQKSYPAFSYTSLDNNPGDSVAIPPYYNGDDIGALHSALDWVDSSIVDASYLWQIQLFTHRNKMLDDTYVPNVLPEFSTTDITIRRAQQFKNFTEGTPLCWMNFHHGELIQSGTITQVYDDTVPAPITVLDVRVFPDGNIFRVMRCDSIQPTGLLPEKLKINSGERFGADQSEKETSGYSLQNSINIYDLSGRKIFEGSILSFTKEQSAATSSSGIYFVKMYFKGQPVYFKWIRS